MTTREGRPLRNNIFSYAGALIHFLNLPRTHTRLFLSLSSSLFLLLTTRADRRQTCTNAAKRQRLGVRQREFLSLSLSRTFLPDARVRFGERAQRAYQSSYSESTSRVAQTDEVVRVAAVH